MARIWNLRARIEHGHSEKLRVAAKGTPADVQALAYAERAVAAHRRLRERLDDELNSTSRPRGFGLIQKRSFRTSTDVFLRESYIALGDAHLVRGMTIERSATGPISRDGPQPDPASLLESRKHLRRALDCFSARTQRNDQTGEPDRRGMHAARIHLACVAIRLGDRQEAADELAAAARVDRQIKGGTSRDPKQHPGQRHLTAEMHTLLADAYYDRAQTVDPASAEQLDAYRAAFAKYREAEQTGVAPAHVYGRLGLLHARFQQTAAAQPESSPNRKALEQNEYFRAAVSYFERATELQPKHAEWHAQLGTVYRDWGRRVHEQTGVADKSQPYFVKALAPLQQALNLRSNDVTTLWTLADAYTWAGRHEDAVNVYRHLSQQPGFDNGSVRKRLGWLYERLAEAAQEPGERSAWQEKAAQAYESSRQQDKRSPVPAATQ
jgi:hypothetical protein